jgi:hypothetical protein
MLSMANVMAGKEERRQKEEKRGFYVVSFQSNMIRDRPTFLHRRCHNINSDQKLRSAHNVPESKLKAGSDILSGSTVANKTRVVA